VKIFRYTYVFCELYDRFGTIVLSVIIQQYSLNFIDADNSNNTYSFVLQRAMIISVHTPRLK